MHKVCVRGFDTIGNKGEPACGAYAVKYNFVGFDLPIKMQTCLPSIPCTEALNSTKAGRVVPIKWRLIDADGRGFDDPVSIRSLETFSVDCFTNELNVFDVPQTAGNSGLQNLGNGYWQYNWKRRRDTRARATGSWSSSTTV